MRLKMVILMVALTLSMAAAKTERLTGLVVRVVDGDTVRVRFTDGEKEVRLANLDAPELTQEGGAASQRALAGYLPEGSQIRITSRGRDRYRRIIGEIYRPDGADVNVLQVRNGQAWVYTKYCRDPRYWQPLEARAREERLGLWVGKQPIPPWDYRGQQHPNSRAPARIDPST